MDGFRAALRLAVESIPAVFFRLATQLLTLLTLGAAARQGTQSLAHFSLALFPYLTLVLIALSMGTGIPLFVANTRIPRLAIRSASFRLAAEIGAFTCLAGLGLAALLASYPELPETYRGSALPLAILSISLPFVVLQHYVTLYLQGLHRNSSGAWNTALGLVVQQALFETFFYIPNLPLPSEAAGVATVALISRITMALHALWIFQQTSARPSSEKTIPARTLTSQLKRFGAPVAFSFGLRSFALTTFSFVLGHYSAALVGAFSVVFNINTLLSMLPNGLFSVASVYIVSAKSSNDKTAYLRELNRVSWAKPGSLACVTLVALTFVPWGVPVFFPDPKIQRMIHEAWPSCVVFLLADSLIVTNTILLRALGDLWSVPVIVSVGLGAVLLPLTVVIAPLGNASSLFFLLALTFTCSACFSQFRYVRAAYSTDVRAYVPSPLLAGSESACKLNP